jgi:hypothetical protein
MIMFILPFACFRP